jgi:hypothetical protein
MRCRAVRLQLRRVEGSRSGSGITVESAGMKKRQLIEVNNTRKQAADMRDWADLALH